MEHYTVKILNMAVNLDTLITMWLCMGIILLTAFLSTRKLTLVPSKPQFIMEKFIDFKINEKIMDVTSVDIMRVAKEYLNDDFVISLLAPEKFLQN